VKRGEGWRLEREGGEGEKNEGKKERKGKINT